MAPSNRNFHFSVEFYLNPSDRTARSTCRYPYIQYSTNVINHKQNIVIYCSLFQQREEKMNSIVKLAHFNKNYLPDFPTLYLRFSKYNTVLWRFLKTVQGIFYTHIRIG